MYNHSLNIIINLTTDSISCQTHNFISNCQLMSTEYNSLAIKMSSLSYDSEHTLLDQVQNIHHNYNHEHLNMSPLINCLR